VRLLLGFILGVIATIAGAYAYDSQSGRAVNGLTTTSADGQAPMVNWDVVSSDWTNFQTNMRVKADNLEKTWKRHTG
jgi:hypothetical protein